MRVTVVSRRVWSLSHPPGWSRSLVRHKRTLTFLASNSDTVLIGESYGRPLEFPMYIGVHAFTLDKTVENNRRMDQIDIASSHLNDLTV